MKRSLLVLCLALANGAVVSAEPLDTYVLTQVGKGKFISEGEIDTASSDAFIAEYKKINSVGCEDGGGWGTLSDDKFDERIRKGMSFVEYLEQSGDDGARAAAYRSQVTAVDLSKEKPVTEQLSTTLMTKGFDQPAPLYNRPAHKGPVAGDREVTRCTVGVCQTVGDLSLWSIVNEVGHANAYGEPCGLKDSTNDILKKLERGTFVFADGRKVHAWRMTTFTRYPIYCGQQNVEPGEDISVRIVTNDLPSLKSPFGGRCGGVGILSESRLTGRQTGKVYWQHKQEIVQQLDR